MNLEAYTHLNQDNLAVLKFLQLHHILVVSLTHIQPTAGEQFILGALQEREMVLEAKTIQKNSKKILPVHGIIICP
jgi:hypothetical protein